MVIIHRTNKHVNIFIPNNLEINHLLNLNIDEDSKEPIRIDDSSDFGNQLKTVFEQKQLYLNSKLTITDAARAIGTNRTYLSSYLNNELKMTFYDFVNSMRIEMIAKQLLKEKVRNFTIEEIAQESGFNSVSTFHRAFLKYTGKTPNDFRKTIDK
jgi:AraC-like DNA-binding protein